jgi:hypothetical protein
MSAVAGRLHYLYLAWLSSPACDRTLYRLIRKHRLRKIVELGVGQGKRAVRMIRVAQLFAAPAAVRYLGIDLFELRGPGCPAGLSLKQSHRLLRATGAKVQLAPGDPRTALERVANSLTGTDLVVISADQEAESLSRAWFYVPRMLHERSLVLVEEPSSNGTPGRLRIVARQEVEALAARHVRRRAA